MLSLRREGPGKMLLTFDPRADRLCKVGMSGFMAKGLRRLLYRTSVKGVVPFSRPYPHTPMRVDAVRAKKYTPPRQR